MPALSGQEIRQRLAADKDRLVVAPLLEANEQIRDEQSSIDVRLGSRFRVAQIIAEGVVDTLRESRRPALSELRHVPLGAWITLHPHHLVLGETLEFVRLPSDVMAYVVGRSSWGREGLVVATATGIHPGFAGPITLELRNLGEVPIRLYPGDPIAQLFLHTVDGVSDAPVKAITSQFAGASGPRRGRHRYPGTEKKLRALIRKRSTDV